MAMVLPIPTPATVAVADTGDAFAVHRIYCVGRNYAAHAREMGPAPDCEPPFFFCKPADAVVADGSTLDFPAATKNLHHEIELVVAIGRGGRDIAAADALDHVWGYAVGLDMTRRDLQGEAKDKGRPWDTGKAFDESAPISAIRPCRTASSPSCRGLPRPSQRRTFVMTRSCMAGSRCRTRSAV